LFQKYSRVLTVQSTITVNHIELINKIQVFELAKIKTRILTKKSCVEYARRGNTL